MPDSVGRAAVRRVFSVATLSTTLVADTVVAQAPWRLVEELRFGTGESDAQTFTNIRGLAVGTGGRILVLDYKVQEIRAFDASEKFLKVVSRRGGGPGEDDVQNVVRASIRR